MTGHRRSHRSVHGGLRMRRSCGRGHERRARVMAPPPRAGRWRLRRVPWRALLPVLRAVLPRLLAVLLPVVMAVLLLAVLRGGPAGASYGDCSLKRLRACANMNELIWAQDFRAALEAFIGDHPTWRREVFNALGGPPRKPRWLTPDLVRFSGCMIHNCWLKGAVFLTADGRILQVAVLQYACADMKCVDKYIVFVLTHDPDPALIRYARDWAYEALEIDPAVGKRFDGYGYVTLEGTKVIKLE